MWIDVENEYWENSGILRKLGTCETTKFFEKLLCSYKLMVQNRLICVNSCSLVKSKNVNNSVYMINIGLAALDIITIGTICSNKLRKLCFFRNANILPTYDTQLYNIFCYVNHGFFILNAF